MRHHIQRLGDAWPYTKKRLGPCVDAHKHECGEKHVTTNARVPKAGYRKKNLKQKTGVDRRSEEETRHNKRGQSSKSGLRVSDRLERFC